MSVMKVISIVVVTLAVIAGAIYYYFAGSMVELDNYIKPMYADLVEQQWSQDAMNKYLCPSAKTWFQDPANAAQIQKMQEIANALGKIKVYGGVNIDDGFNVSSSTDTGTTAEANVPITFEGGKKIVATNLGKVDRKYCLLGFKFLEPKSQAGATHQEQKPAEVQPAETQQPAEPAPAPESEAAPAQDQAAPTQDQAAPAQDQEAPADQAAPEQQDQTQQPADESSKDQPDQQPPAEPADQQDQSKGQ